MVIENWRPVVGYEGLYEVSDQGRVRSLRRKCDCPQLGGHRTVPERIMVGTPWGPYLAVTLFLESSRRRRNVQWLVMEAFVGPKPLGLEVCHNNSNPHDNSLKNLRYDTRSGNFSDKTYGGRGSRGKNLTKDKVVEIRKLAESKSQIEIAKIYGVDNTTINSIVLRRNWKNVA